MKKADKDNLQKAFEEAKKIGKLKLADVLPVKLKGKKALSITRRAHLP